MLEIESSSKAWIARWKFPTGAKRQDHDDDPSSIVLE